MSWIFLKNNKNLTLRPFLLQIQVGCKRHSNITSMQITTIHATFAQHKQAARRQLGGFTVVSRQHRRRGRRLQSERRQYVASKHARRYERRVSAVPALISGKPPQICPANSGSLSLIVVKKRGQLGDTGTAAGERKKGPRLLLAPSLYTFLQTIRNILFPYFPSSFFQLSEYFSLCVQRNSSRFDRLTRSLATLSQRFF